ncbi:hypothetical protein B0H16DRAFT_555712 [Mycena metata]|uniref:Uncharacterized protein n=1 Tax=Mycena metata TaxID=1033252 RepID=A0AAD7NH87_9AGAR|nr:hypothetical protein B0H16DRAFT_555712 [Mycena metata]
MCCSNFMDATGTSSAPFHDSFGSGASLLGNSAAARCPSRVRIGNRRQALRQSGVWTRAHVSCRPLDGTATSMPRSTTRGPRRHRRSRLKNLFAASQVAAGRSSSITDSQVGRHNRSPFVLGDLHLRVRLVQLTLRWLDYDMRLRLRAHLHRSSCANSISTQCDGSFGRSLRSMVLSPVWRGPQRLSLLASEIATSEGLWTPIHSLRIFSDKEGRAASSRPGPAQLVASVYAASLPRQRKCSHRRIATDTALAPRSRLPPGLNFVLRKARGPPLTHSLS